jgi:hypothetical protein
MNRRQLLLGTCSLALAAALPPVSNYTFATVDIGIADAARIVICRYTGGQWIVERA